MKLLAVSAACLAVSGVMAAGAVRVLLDELPYARITPLAPQHDVGECWPTGEHGW